MAGASTRSWIAKFLIVGSVVVLLLLGAGYAFLRVCFPAYIVGSHSMAPGLQAGDTVLVNRLERFLGKPPQRDAPVVYRSPLDRAQIYLHRIAGVPGDRLKLRDKKLYRNGAEVAEPYTQHIDTITDSYRDNFPAPPDAAMRPSAQDMLENHVQNGEVVVPAGQYFVLGDNREDAFDSRYAGFVPLADILGRPTIIIRSKDPKRDWKPVR